MTSFLHQLENNEAILLMYLAEELSAEDRAEVEQMLASDASLRAELDRVRAINDGAIAALRQLDAGDRLPVSQGVAVRRATRMMRQWQIDRAQAPPPIERVKELRFPWWSYPLTTAAAVLIAFLVWWGNRPDRIERDVVQNYEDAPSGPQDLEGMRAEAEADLLAESFDISEDELLRMALNHQVDEALERLAATAERPDDVDLIFMNSTERNW